MMKKIFVLLSAMGTALFSSALMAHLGHGGYDSMASAGHIHPAAGIEHYAMVAVSVVSVYLLLKLVRK